MLKNNKRIEEIISKNNNEDKLIEENISKNDNETNDYEENELFTKILLKNNIETNDNYILNF